MEWYEIIGLVVVWFLGLILRGKIYEFRRDYNKNSSRKSRDREGRVLEGFFLFNNLIPNTYQLGIKAYQKEIFGFQAKRANLIPSIFDVWNDTK